MSEENKALFRRFVNEVVTDKNVDLIDELMAAGFVDHNPPPGVPPGMDGMKEMMGMFFAAFPDLTLPPPLICWSRKATWWRAA